MFDETRIDKDSPIPLYYQLKQIILNFISNKENGTSLPTAQEICDHFKISQTTVRQALNELVTEGFVVRKKGKGTAVQKTEKKLADIYRSVSPMTVYAPSDFQISEDLLRNMKMFRIALCAQTTESSYFNHLYKSITKELKRYQIQVDFYDSNSNIKRQITDIRHITEEKTDLIIIDPCSPPQELNAAMAGVFEKNIPVIAVNSHLNPLAQHLTYVGCDNTELGYRVGVYISSYLKKQEAQKPWNLAVIEGPAGNIAGEEREKGFFRGLYSFLQENEINVVDRYSGDWSRDSGYEAVKAFLCRQAAVKLVYAYNDSMALGGMDAAGEMGRRDIIFAGIDGSKDAMESILKGESLKVVGINDPIKIGKLTAELALKFLNTGLVPSRVILTEPLIISAENVRAYYREKSAF